MTSPSTDSYYKEGYQIALENARSLSKIANISALENEFGIACSLSILAAEESVKAIFLLLKGFNVQIELEDFDKVFKYHQTKHFYYTETSSAFQAIVEIFYTKGGLANYIIEMIEQLLPEAKLKSFLKEHTLFIDFLKKIKMFPDIQIKNEKLINIEEEKKWWKNANLEKNRGLYVDKAEGTWHNPKSFTKEKYLEVREHTHYIIENVEKVENLLNP